MTPTFPTDLSPLVKMLEDNGYKVTPPEPAPDLPPKPSQEWLDKHGVELTGEYREPKPGELVQHSTDLLRKPLVADEFWLSPDSRWILRRRAPQVRPWTIDTVPMPLVVRGKQNTGFMAQAVRADLDGVWLVNNTYGNVLIISYANTLRDFTQRDGSPCGEEVK